MSQCLADSQAFKWVAVKELNVKLPDYGYIVHHMVSESW